MCQCCEWVCETFILCGCVYGHHMRFNTYDILNQFSVTEFSCDTICVLVWKINVEVVDFFSFFKYFIIYLHIYQNRENLFCVLDSFYSVRIIEECRWIVTILDSSIINILFGKWEIRYYINQLGLSSSTACRSGKICLQQSKFQ